MANYTSATYCICCCYVTLYPRLNVFAVLNIMIAHLYFGTNKSNTHCETNGSVVVMYLCKPPHLFPLHGGSSQGVTSVPAL